MATLERAIAIAAEAHAGQRDKAGAPYILHPLRVMLRLGDPVDRIVAVLHDVVEDAPAWPLERLRAEGFSEEVLEAVERLTKRPGEDYEESIERAGAHPIARRVKVADLEDNMDLARLERYRRAHARLTET